MGGYSRDPERKIEGATEVRDFSEPEAADYRGLDALIHLAGEPILGIWTAGKKQRIYDSRVSGTRALVRGLEKLPSSERPKALVSASAIGFYGNSGDAVVDEDSDVGFGLLAEVVRDWDAAAGAHHEADPDHGHPHPETPGLFGSGLPIQATACEDVLQLLATL